VSGPSGPRGQDTGLSGPSGPSGPAGALVAKTITLKLRYSNTGVLLASGATVESSENLPGLTLTTYDNGTLKLSGLSGSYARLPSSFSTLVYKASNPNSLNFFSIGATSAMYMTADPRGATPVAFGFSGGTLYGGYFTTNSLPFDSNDATIASGVPTPAVQVILYYFV
jgi:hypothetical protein